MAHFLGKRNLEVYTARLASVKLNERPRIRVFAVNNECYRVPTWKEFEKVIRDALVDTSEKETDEIIHNLREKVITGKGLNQDAVRSIAQFRQFVQQEVETCDLRMHCEAVVAALLVSRRSQPMEYSTEQESNYKYLAELSEVLGLVPECEIFYSCLPRTWPTVWFRFQNYAAQSVGSFSKFSTWETEFVAFIPP